MLWNKLATAIIIRKIGSCMYCYINNVDKIISCKVFMIRHSIIVNKHKFQIVHRLNIFKKWRFIFEKHRIFGPAKHAHNLTTSKNEQEESWGRIILEKGTTRGSGTCCLCPTRLEKNVCVLPTQLQVLQEVSTFYLF